MQRFLFLFLLVSNVVVAAQQTSPNRDNLERLFLNNVPDIAKLIDSDSKLTHRRDTLGKSVLHYLCRFKSTGAAIEMIVAQDASLLAAVDNHGFDALHDAVVNNNLEAVKVLLKLWPNCFLERSFQSTIMEAAKEDRFEIFKTIFETAVKSLPKKKWDILKFESSQGHTIAHALSFLKRLNNLKLVLKHVPQMVEVLDPDGNTCLHWACQLLRNTDEIHLAPIAYEIVQYLYELRPSMLGIMNQQGLSAFHVAVQKGLFRIVHYFLDLDPSLLYKKTASGKLPIYLAIDSGDLDTYNFLLAQDPEIINVTDSVGGKLIDYAVASNQTVIIKEMVKSNAQIGSMSALIIALSKDNHEFVDHYFSCNQPELNLQDVQRTLLALIVINRSLKSLELFFKHFPDCFSDTALVCSEDHLSTYLTWFDILERLLEQYPSLIFIKTGRGQSLLHLVDKSLKFGENIDKVLMRKRLAARENQTSFCDIALLLIKHGMSDQIIDYAGRTFLGYVPADLKIKVVKLIAKFNLIRPLVDTCIYEKEYEKLRFLGTNATLAYSVRQLHKIIRELPADTPQTKLFPLIQICHLLIAQSDEVAVHLLQGKTNG